MSPIGGVDTEGTENGEEVTDEYRPRWKKNLQKRHLEIEGFEKVGDGCTDLSCEGKVEILKKRYNGKEHWFFVDEDGGYVSDFILEYRDR